MHAGRFVFSELIAHLPHKEFQKCVARYSDGMQWRRFSPWDQYLTMAFAQLTYRESLRDIGACLRSVSGKLYHLGFRGKVAKTTLADANESRDYRIFADFAHVLESPGHSTLTIRWVSTWIKVCMRWIRRLSICAWN